MSYLTGTVDEHSTVVGFISPDNQLAQPHLISPDTRVEHGMHKVYLTQTENLANATYNPYLSELLEEMEKLRDSAAITSCPYCNSKDVDWGFDSDSSTSKIITTAVCSDCGKMWEMIYKFSEWRPIED